MHAANTMPGEQRRLAHRLARDERDIAAVQRLRWQVFCEEMGANPGDCRENLDADPFDALCDHLLVIDGSGDEDGAVVGTYRLLRENVASRAGGFYSAGEFDIRPLAAARGGKAGELLELGRSCVLPAYRTSGTISLLWRGIAEYIARHDIALMFGCASFSGTDPDAHAESLSLLAHRHRAPDGQCPRVHPGKGVALERLAAGTYDERRALLAMPPLVKGYLRVGARFGDGAYIDHAFNTIDVCVVMPVDLLSARYVTRFSAAA